MTTVRSRRHHHHHLHLHHLHHLPAEETEALWLRNEGNIRMQALVPSQLTILSSPKYRGHFSQFPVAKAELNRDSESQGWQHLEMGRRPSHRGDASMAGDLD